MHDALTTLASVWKEPAAPGASAALDRLRGRWPGLSAEERAALTPIARLAAARVTAASAPPVVSEEDDYYASIAASEEDGDDDGRWGDAAAGSSPAAPVGGEAVTERRPGPA
ncbi:MAG: ATP-dependent DNA helicase RecQ, partial [Solirubrobacterales bacterium]|nr:ATP-dependent DNA helicase RecQ [Solirubrobacterales bacterium]